MRLTRLQLDALPIGECLSVTTNRAPAGLARHIHAHPLHTAIDPLARRGFSRSVSATDSKFVFVALPRSPVGLRSQPFVTAFINNPGQITAIIASPRPDALLLYLRCLPDFSRRRCRLIRMPNRRVALLFICHRDTHDDQRHHPEQRKTRHDDSPCHLHRPHLLPVMSLIASAYMLSNDCAKTFMRLTTRRSRCK
jgi:hypothetical protein